MLARIRKDDLVTVVSGRDKGKQGHIIEIDKDNDKVLVKGLSIVTRHLKPTKRGEKGKIAKEESYMDICKVMPVCPSCKKPCRIQVRALDEKKKTRVCHKCKEAF